MGTRGETGTMFVVMSPTVRPILVSHYGKIGGQGTWICSKDNQVQCSHVAVAKKNPAFVYLRQSAQDEGDEGSSTDEDVEDIVQAAAERERGKQSIETMKYSRT